MVLLDICSNVELRENSHYCRKYNPQPLRFISEKKKKKRKIKITLPLAQICEAPCSPMSSSQRQVWTDEDAIESPAPLVRDNVVCLICFTFMPIVSNVFFSFIKSICWVYSLSALKSMTLFYFILNYSIILYILIW